MDLEPGQRLVGILNLEGLSLLRDHRGDGTESHDLAEQNPRDGGERRDRDATPAKVHAPGRHELPRFENVVFHGSAHDSVFGSLVHPRVTVLGPLAVNYRQGEQSERR